MEKALLALLVCPQTGAPLYLSKDKQELWCYASRLAYPIHDGVPVMLPEQARMLNDEEWAKRGAK